MSSPIALPVAPTRRALIRTSVPAPEPRSRTDSPGCRSATAVGTPQPSDAPTAAPVAPSVSAPSYKAEPNTASLSGPQPHEDGPCAATWRAAAAYFSRTVSRTSPVGSPAAPAAHPQLPPAALVPQDEAFSEGSQQVSCAFGGAAARGLEGG